LHRIDTTTAQKDKWGSGKNGWTNGDPTTGVKATSFNANFCDSIQEELCNAIEKAGLTLDPNDNTQLWQVLNAGFGKYLAIKNNLSEIAAAGADAQSAARKNLSLGTVATLDATTSTTDNTVGHVLKVGDRGLGMTSIGAISDFDFYNYVFAAGETLFIDMASAINTPDALLNAGLGYSYLDVIGIRDGNIGDVGFILSDYVTGKTYFCWRHTDAQQTRLWSVTKLPTSATDIGALPITGGTLQGILGFSFQADREDANCLINHLDKNGKLAFTYGYYNNGFSINFYDENGGWISNPLYLDENGDISLGGDVSGGNIFDNGKRVYSPNNPQDMSAYITSSTANGKFVTGVRLGANMSTHWGSEGGTAPAGCVLTGGDFGDGDSYPYYAYMQYCVSGTWINASGGVGAENLVSANHYQVVPDSTISLLTNLRPYLRESNHLPGLAGVQHYIDDNGYDWFEAAPKLAGAVFIAVAPESGVIVQIADSILPDTDAFSLYPNGVTVAGLDSLPEGCTIDGTWKFDSESRTVSQDADLSAALALTKNTQLLAQYAANATLNIATLQAGIASDRSVDGDSNALTAWQGYLCDLRAMTTEDLQQSPAIFPDAPASVF
jgi:hypothetical protein